MSLPAMLAGASVGALILTQIYWGCGFLRMSSTGLSAQAKGVPNNTLESAKVLWQTVTVALLLGGAVLVLQSPILFCSMIFYSILFHSILLYSIMFCSVMFW